MSLCIIESDFVVVCIVHRQELDRVRSSAASDVCKRKMCVYLCRGQVIMNRCWGIGMSSPQSLHAGRWDENYSFAAAKTVVVML